MPRDELEKAQITREWLERTRDDLALAERACQPPPIERLALYHYQQAAEKVLKAYLTWHDQPFRQTHHLPDLVRECARLSPHFADLLEAAATLTPYAHATRYPGAARTYTVEDIDEARRHAHAVRDFVRARLPPSLLR